MGDLIPAEKKQKEPSSLPSNYVSLAVLRQRWLLKQNQQPQEEEKPKHTPNPKNENQNQHKNGRIEKGKKIQQDSNQRVDKGKKIEEDSNQRGSEIDKVEQVRNGNVSQKKRRKRFRRKGRVNKTLDIGIEVKEEIEDEKQIGKAIEEQKEDAVVTSEANGKKSRARNGGYKNNRWVNKMGIEQKFEGLSINNNEEMSYVKLGSRDRDRFGGWRKSRMIWVVKSDGKAETSSDTLSS